MTSNGKKSTAKMVHWYPWDQATFELARAQNKPIFLNIGYQSCHWCHVMEQESFSDLETASILNDHFICIQVDAYVRPDIDKVYQSAYQLIHQQPGGWPLNAFLTPNAQVPFLIGTYFPKWHSEGMPSFKEILIHTSHHYQQSYKTLEQNHSPLVAAMGCLAESPMQPKEDSMNERPLTIARIEWESDFDDVHGGFGTSPKFPHPGFLEGLMEYWYATCHSHEEDKSTLKMVYLSLQKMAEGGIYDQIGGGFFRYASDPSWKIPHFEKMLYDNALLLKLYAQCYQCIQEPLFEKVVRETVEWLLLEAQMPEGGFYASLDSDVDGVEGGYYRWDQQTLHALFSEEESAIIKTHWGFDLPSNAQGHWYPAITTPVLELASRYRKTTHEIDEMLCKARQILQNERNKRQKPIFDRKLITGWNALTIRALMIAYGVFQEKSWLNAAERTIQRIYQNLWFNGRLYTGYQNGQCASEGFLDDYAFLIEALLQYLQYDWNSEYFVWAQQLLDRALFLFEDLNEGGFFFTPKDAAPLLFRPKVLAEDGIPSGGAILCKSALLLGHILGEVRYLTAAEKAIQNADYMLHHLPSMHSTFLSALELYVNPTEWVVIRGENEVEGREWVNQALKKYHPRRLVWYIPINEKNLPALLAERVPADLSRTVAYMGNGVSVRPVVTRFEELLK